MLSSRKGASGRVHSESACTESELSMIALAANQELAVLGHGDGETLTTFSARRHRPRPDVKLKAEYKAMAEELGDSNGLGTACNTIGITLEKKGDLPNTARALVQGLVAYQRVERGSMEVCADEIGLLAESRSKIIACIPCRQLKRRCEDVRPCRSCTLRGCANECVDDGRSSACALCRSRRVKCDRQRPCSRCVQRGLGHACRSLHPPALGLADTQEDWEEDAAGTGKDSEEISMALPVGLSSSKSQAMRGILLQHFAIQRPIKRKFAVDLSECPGWDEIGRVLKRLSLDYCFQQAGDGSGDNPLVRFFEAGWNLHSGMRLFNYLPRDVKMALDEGMHTLMKLQLLIREMNRPPSTHAASSTPLHAIGAGQAHLEGLGPSAASTGAPHTPVSPHTPASASGSVLGHPHGPLIAGAAGNRVRDDGAAADVVVDSEEDKREYFAGLIAKYGMSPECGVYSFQWDPETGRRVSVQVSESLSDMLGMHTEEFLARVGRREHNFCNTEQEVLSRLLSELLGDTTFKDSLTRIIVCDPKTRKLTRHFLARVISVREFDTRKKLVRTVNLIDRITPEQYDAVGTGRHLLFVDERSGEQLLAGALKDYLFDERTEAWNDAPGIVSSVVSRIREKTEKLKSTVAFMQRARPQSIEGERGLEGGRP